MEVEQEPVVDIPKACRLCLNSEDDEKMFKIDEEIFELIWSCGVKIFDNHELPGRICTNCHSILQFIRKFHNMCENSSIYLQEYLEEIAQNTELEKVVTKKEIEPIEDDSPELIETNENLQEKIIPDIEAPEVLDEEIIQEEQLEEENDGDAEYLYDANNTMPEETVEMGKVAILNDSMNKSENEETAEEDEELWIEESCMEDDEYEQTVYIVQAQNDRINASRILESEKSQKMIKTEEPENKHPTTKPYTCDICGNSFKKLGSFHSHRRRHGNSKPYECEICSARFDYNFKLERHMRKHTGARPFVCEYCDRKFVDRSTMSRHQKVHRDERAYSCEECGKSFNYFSVLKTHIMSHTGEKPYACGICNKGFHRASDLRNHLSINQHRQDPRVPELLKNIRRKDEC